MIYSDLEKKKFKKKILKCFLLPKIIIFGIIIFISLAGCAGAGADRGVLLFLLGLVLAALAEVSLCLLSQPGNWDCKLFWPGINWPK